MQRHSLSYLLRAARVTALALAMGLTLSAYKSVESLFAPDAELWDRWLAHDPSNKAPIDYSRWDRVLGTYVRPSADGPNVFAYGDVTPEDRQMLADFIDGLGQIAISQHQRQEQLAYWINLYNALTVRVILDHYPVETIRDIDISPGLFAEGPWDKKLITVEGEALSLNDIEHRILRPIWTDPRIHYAVNCASIGCPNLEDRAYTGARADAMLEAAARDYINDLRGVKVENGRVTVSKIYDWFDEDFGGSTKAVLAHLVSYAEPELKAQLEAIGTIHGTAYDWGLNEPR